MIINILITVVIFAIAVAGCIIFNYTFAHIGGAFFSAWVKQVLYIACVVGTMVSAYYTLSLVWGTV